MALASVLKKINSNAVKAASEKRTVGKKVETLADKKSQVIAMIDDQIKAIDNPNATTKKGKKIRRAWYMGSSGVYYSVKLGLSPVKLFEGADFYGPLDDTVQLKKTYSAIRDAVEEGELDQQIQESWQALRARPRGRGGRKRKAA